MNTKRIAETLLDIVQDMRADAWREEIATELVAVADIIAADKFKKKQVLEYAKSRGLSEVA